jgi:hypothetical protein
MGELRLRFCSGSQWPQDCRVFTVFYSHWVPLTGRCASLSTPNKSISLAFPVSQRRVHLKQIDQEVGISPEVTLFLCVVPSSHDNPLEALLFASLSFEHLRIRAAMAFKNVIMFFHLTHLVCCTSPNDLGSDLTILIDNDLLGKSRSTHCLFDLTLFVNRSRKPLRRF